MSTLKELMSKILDKRAEASVSPEDADPKVRAGVEAMVRNAKRDLEELETEYREASLANVVLIAIKGDGDKEFADTARIAFDTPVVNYKTLPDRIKASVHSKSPRADFSTQEFFMVLDELNRIKLEYQILNIPPPQVNPAVDRVYGCPVDEAIDNLLRTNYDEQLSSAIVRREIGKLALDLKFAGKTLPVVLYGYDGALDETMLPRPMVTVKAEKDKVNKDFVKEVLTQVKTRLGGGPARTKKPVETAEKTESEKQT